MSRVEINAGGRQVAIEHSGDLEHIAKYAQELWDHTAGAKDEPGPAFGFGAERSGRYRAKGGEYQWYGDPQEPAAVTSTGEEHQ